MNNIEIKNISGLEPGMNDKQINKLKNKKEVKEVEVKEVEVKEEKLPIAKDDIIDLVEKVEVEVKTKLSDYIKLDLYKDERDERDYKLSENIDYIDVDLTASVDWTSKMSPVKDQGSLGSCVGFATTAMKEFQEQIEQDNEVSKGKKYKRKDPYDLSEAWVYWNCKKIDPWPNEEGTSIRCAMQVLKKIGVPCEKAYPYNDRYKGEPEKWAKLISKWGLIDSYYRCSNLTELKTALSNGPVVIGIACFNEIFYTGTNGIVAYPSNPNNILGGHAICVVGYNDKTGLVKFKNSWGKEWGKKGYGFLSYKYINNFMWDGWVAKDLQVTKKILNDNVNNEL